MSFETPQLENINEAPINLEEELENITRAAVKLKEKYGEYNDIKVFIDYLAGTERIFLSMKAGGWKTDKVKEVFIDKESYWMSLDLAIDENVFKMIKDDFQSAYQTIDLISSIAAKLIKEHANCPACVDFIRYMRDSLNLLSDALNLNIGKKEDEIIRSKMSLICKYNDKMNLGELEGIYSEFRSLLGKR